MAAKMLIAKACLLPECKYGTKCKSSCLWNIKCTTFDKSEVFNSKVVQVNKWK